jgi:hypothetical protein
VYGVPRGTSMRTIMADRSSSTVRIKTIRSSIDNSESTAADQQHSLSFE